MSTQFLSPSPANYLGGAPDTTAYTDAAYSSSSSASSSSTSVVVVVIVVASAVVISGVIFLLLRLLSKRFDGSFRTFSAAEDVVPTFGSFNGGQREYDIATSSLLDSLPLFTFGSVTGNLGGGDCAVCLSKFEKDDQLRLLPLCCHAFHAVCIDSWIASNQSCPLCRSSVIPSESDLLGKILTADNRGGVGSTRNGNSGSFRVEIGSISRRRGVSVEATAADGVRRAYSMGSFDYIVDENGYEVSVASTNHRRGPSDSTSVDKESSIGIPIQEPPSEALAAEVSTGRNWLRDYFDRLPSISRSSRAFSFRGSGRFFTGSSRRTDVPPPCEDLDPTRVGQEISELFRWLTGI